jgi:hypothetical protein
VRGRSPDLDDEVHADRKDEIRPKRIALSREEYASDFASEEEDFEAVIGFRDAHD